MLVRKDLFEIVQLSQGDNSSKIQFKYSAKRETVSEMLRASVVLLRTVLRRRRKMLYNYCNKVLCTWDKSKRTRDRFLVVCSKRLNQELILPSEVHVLEITAHLGCLKMSFPCNSDRHKPMREVSAPELPYTAQKSL